MNRKSHSHSTDSGTSRPCCGLRALCILCLLLCPVGASAQDSPRKSEELTAEAVSEEVAVQQLELEEMVVVANRSRRQLFEVGRAAEVVGREEIVRKNPDSLPDLLAESTGVHVQKTNGGAGAPIIRGMVGPDNLILVDGVRYNNSTFRTGPNQYLSLIDPWALERVEVVRGPGSVWYGSDAIGGVLYAQTESPRALDDRLLGAGGRFTFDSATLGGGGMARIDLQSGPMAGYGGGTFLRWGELRTGGGARAALSDYDRFGGRLKMTQELGGGWRAIQAAFWTSTRGAGRTDTLGQGRVRSYDNDDLLTFVRAEREGEGWLSGLRVNLSYHRTRELSLDYRCQTGEDKLVTDAAGCAALQADLLTKKTELDDIVHTPGFFATWEARQWQNRVHLLAGLEGYYDRVESAAREAGAGDGFKWVDKDRGSYSGGSSYLSLGAFVGGDVDVARWDRNRVNIGGGGRASHFAARAAEVPGIGDLDYQYTGLVGAAGLKYLYGSSLNVYADFSQGFRAPNLQETTALGNTGKSFDAPNDDLEPVRANTVEVGAKVNVKLFRVTLAGFGTWLGKAFERVELSEAEWKALGLTAEEVGELPVYRRENAASAFYKGVEGLLAVGPVAGFSLWANGAWMTGEVERKSGETGPASRVPPLMGAGGLKWEAPEHGLFAEFFVKWALRQDQLAAEDLQDLRICEDPKKLGALLTDCRGTAGWVTYNLRAGYQPLDFLQTNLTLENLADSNYRYHGSGIDGPGFTALLGVSVNY